MDQATLASYDADPQTFVKRWIGRGTPAGLYAQLQKYFKPGGRTAEIGSGSGREMVWLAENGFPAIGYDASPGLVAAVKAAHPELELAVAALPELAGVGAHQFDNVLCKAVIMHLPRAEIVPAVQRMFELLKPGGVLHLSWRVTRDADMRDKYDRLYSAFDADLVHEALPRATTLFEDEVLRPNGTVLHRLIVRA
jgi:2-polyprenyl-3-methyl-5-hydroxy-6-metoxy-1,4-benzoquinol methylase